MIELNKNSRESRLLYTIKHNPGLQFRQLMRRSGLKNGVLSHYLVKLEKRGLVRVAREPRQARYYHPKITPEESKVIKALRRQTPRDLLFALVMDDGLEFGSLIKKTGKAPSTVSFYLSQIVDAGLVEIRCEKSKKRYHLKIRKTVDALIEQYRPSFVESSTSGFEDIIRLL